MLKRVLAYGIVLSAAAAVIWKKFSPQSSPLDSSSNAPGDHDRDLDFTFEQQAMLAAMRQQIDEICTAAAPGGQPALKS
jgi:hypothetical protein